MHRYAGLGRLHAAARRAYATESKKPVFFDMKHSNNAARVRLWLALKDGVAGEIDTKMIKYPDLQTPEFAAVNPLKKVPALIRSDGSTVFESSVILNYLEHKYTGLGFGPSFLPECPEDRQLMDLFCRCHDLYVASPNCTMPGFSHSQGAMYLAPYETPFCPAVRCMDRDTRAKKIAELWKQLSWLDANMRDAKYLVGDDVTLADMTWYPTTIFMEFMLPRVFGWPDIFRDSTHLPNFARWWTRLTNEEEAFARVRDQINEYWQEMWEAGQFESILGEVKDKNYQWSYPVQWEGDQRVMLNYQEPPPDGKRTGRFIGKADEGFLVDENDEHETTMHDGRLLSPAATLETHGFSLASHPTAVTTAQFEDDDEQVVKTYYEEIMSLVKAQSGASRVYVFDHTVRESGNTNLNAAEGGSAAPVPRVHCDYTADGAPRRLELLGEAGIFSRIKQRELTKEEVEDLASRRFAFINVWRSIDDKNPIMQKPLAVCDERSVPPEDKFLYELHFPDRVGENYSLKFNTEHEWYMYPKMTMDECLVFKVYDKKEDGPRFVFHTAYTDPRGGPAAVPRKSIEVRTIAFYDHADDSGVAQNTQGSHE